MRSSLAEPWAIRVNRAFSTWTTPFRSFYDKNSSPWKGREDGNSGQGEPRQKTATSIRRMFGVSVNTNGVRLFEQILLYGFMLDSASIFFAFFSIFVLYVIWRNVYIPCSRNFRGNCKVHWIFKRGIFNVTNTALPVDVPYAVLLDSKRTLWGKWKRKYRNSNIVVFCTGVWINSLREIQRSYVQYFTIWFIIYLFRNI